MTGKPKIWKITGSKKNVFKAFDDLVSKKTKTNVWCRTRETVTVQSTFRNKPFSLKKIKTKRLYWFAKIAKFDQVNDELNYVPETTLFSWQGCMFLTLALIKNIIYLLKYTWLFGYSFRNLILVRNEESCPRCSFEMLKCTFYLGVCKKQ